MLVLLFGSHINDAIKSSVLLVFKKISSCGMALCIVTQLISYKFVKKMISQTICKLFDACNSCSESVIDSMIKLLHWLCPYGSAYKHQAAVCLSLSSFCCQALMQTAYVLALLFEGWCLIAYLRWWLQWFLDRTVWHDCWIWCIFCIVIKVLSGYCRMRVKKLPHVLALHLKRFKLEQPNRSIKLSYRVVFPLELRLFNTVVTRCYLFILCRMEHDHILQLTDWWMFCTHLSVLSRIVLLTHDVCMQNINR